MMPTDGKGRGSKVTELSKRSWSKHMITITTREYLAMPKYSSTVEAPCDIRFVTSNLNPEDVVHMDGTVIYFFVKTHHTSTAIEVELNMAMIENKKDDRVLI